jgi:acyl-coenzyme A synthetase/AMP-(fatty) acid ligase
MVKGRAIPLSLFPTRARPRRNRAIYLWLTKTDDDPGNYDEVRHVHIFIGDLALVCPDGCILHLGRKDFQIKIGGHRLESTEVEAAPLDLAGIEQAFTMRREDRPSDQQLVAHIVAAPTPAPTVSAMRCALAQRLPIYMIPRPL